VVFFTGSYQSVTGFVTPVILSGGDGNSGILKLHPGSMIFIIAIFVIRNIVLYILMSEGAKQPILSVICFGNLTPGLHSVAGLIPDGLSVLIGA